MWLNRRRAVAVVVASAAVLVAGAACKTGEPDAVTTTTAPVVETTVPATTTTSLLSTATTAPKPGMSPDEVAVRNVLDIENAEFSAALDPPDPNRPGVLALNTGAARAKRVEVITGLRDRGEYSRRDAGGPIPHKTDALDIEGPNTAIAYECYVDDRVRRKVATNEIVDGTTSSVKFRTTVVREGDGAWRISAREILESYPTRNACPHVA